MFNNILILVEDYPSSKSAYPMAYVHSRVVEYLNNKEYTVNVISFSAKEDYIYENVKVLCASSAKDLLAENVVLVSHAPNIRNHLKLLIKHRRKKIVFFIHGHEFLDTKKYYPKNYSWLKTGFFNKMKTEFYDFIKLKIWYFFLKFFFTNTNFVFVSNWMEEEASKCIGYKLKNVHNSAIIYNPVHIFFYQNKYNFFKSRKDFDFVTIRPFDKAKYCIDIVYDLSVQHPEYRFLVIGEGEFFKYNKPPKNMTVLEGFLSQEKLGVTLDNCRIALMPTRLDAQGVMMCEMGCYGIPVITSDIPIAREVFEGCAHVRYINNFSPVDKFKFISEELFDIDIIKIDDSIRVLKNRFNNKQLTAKELKFIGKSL